MVEPTSPKYPKRDKFTFLEAAYIISDEKIPAKYLTAPRPHVVNERLKDLWGYCRSLAQEINDVFGGEKKFGKMTKANREVYESLKKRIFFKVAHALGFSPPKEPDQQFLETEASRADIVEWCRINHFKPKEFLNELRDPSTIQTTKPPKKEREGGETNQKWTKHDSKRAKYWDKFDKLSLRDAACLWMGMWPDETDNDNYDDNDCHLAERLIMQECQKGRLKNLGSTSAGGYGNEYIFARKDIIALAKSHGEFPLTLFPDRRPKPTSSQTVEPPKSKRESGELKPIWTERDDELAKRLDKLENITLDECGWLLVGVWPQDGNPYHEKYDEHNLAIRELEEDRMKYPIGIGMAQIGRSFSVHFAKKNRYFPATLFPEKRIKTPPKPKSEKRPKKSQANMRTKNAIPKKGFYVSGDDYSTVYMGGKPYILDTDRRREIVKILHEKGDWMTIADLQSAVKHKSTEHLIKASFKGRKAEKIKNALLENDQKRHWRIRKS